MRWLALEGALGPFGAATGGPPGEVVATTEGNDALERGLAAVAQALGESRLCDVDALAVGTGPGGFTGLRIALSYAKALALAAGKPLLGISSYDALEPIEAAGTRATFVHGRTGIASVRLRTNEGERIASGTYAELATFVADALGTTGELSCYGAAGGTAPALGERGISVRHLSTGIEPPVLAVLRRAIACGTAGDPHHVTADYGEAAYHERAQSGA